MGLYLIILAQQENYCKFQISPVANKGYMQ